MTDYNEIRKEDPEIFEIMEMEEKRQESFLELIASENIVSKAVMQAAGSHLTNKYAEGYPGKRNYGGCEYVDMVEELAKKRAMSLFGAEYANVQPHSGSQANLAVFQAFMKPGDTLLGMDISHGGHITHGSPENLSGKMYNVITYGVRRDTETIDYNKVEDLIRIHRPRIVIAGASAYPRNIDFKVMSEMAHRYDALLMADMAHIAGLVAAEEHMNPVEYADVVTSATNKTAQRTQGRIYPLQGRIWQTDRQSCVPRDSGRSSHERHSSQGRMLQRGDDPEVQEVPEADRKKCQSPCRKDHGKRDQGRFRRH